MAFYDMWAMSRWDNSSNHMLRASMRYKHIQAPATSTNATHILRTYINEPAAILLYTAFIMGNVDIR
jgi:hypothetical protein